MLKIMGNGNRGVMKNPLERLGMGTVLMMGMVKGLLGGAAIEWPTMTVR